MADSTYHYGLGRRKSSTARGRLYANGSGKVTINNKSLEDFTAGSKSLQFEFMKPLMLVHKEKDFDITILVKGGGIHGQIDAARLSVSKALANLSDDYKATLKKGGFLKRDPREKERKKYGLKGARKKEQFSKR